MSDRAQIVRVHRDYWVEKFVEDAHEDLTESMRIDAEIAIALTDCYWDVFHGKSERRRRT